MPVKKLPLWPAFGLSLLWLTVYVLGKYWIPPKMATTTYHQLVGEALVYIGAGALVYLVCVWLWLREYRERFAEVQANLDAAYKYIHKDIPSTRCLNDAEALEHIRTARLWMPDLKF